MTNATETARKGSLWRVAGWSIAGLALLAPLVAMQFTREVNWTVGDFIFAAMLIGLVGVTLELAVRASPNGYYRGGAATAIAASFLTIWVNGAVGMIGSEDNPYNLFFFTPVGAALIGSVLARFRPGGMALAMLVASAAQGAFAIGGMSADMRGGTFSVMFAGLWLLSAAMFRNAAEARE